MKKKKNKYKSNLNLMKSKENVHAMVYINYKKNLIFHSNIML